jgi:hypothetical protein
MGLNPFCCPGHGIAGQAGLIGRASVAREHAEPSLLDWMVGIASGGWSEKMARDLARGARWTRQKFFLATAKRAKQSIKNRSLRAPRNRNYSPPSSTQISGVLRVSTSVAYLRKRLADIGRHDLLEACENGLVSTYAAAEEAGLVKRAEPVGTGSENAAKRRYWALAKITRGASPLAPKPEPQPAPEIRPTPSAPKFSQGTRDIIERLVAAGRADLVIAVTERRISPFQAARIAERSARETRRDVTKSCTVQETESSPRTVEPETVQKPARAKPEAKRLKPDVKRLDPRALIG